MWVMTSKRIRGSYGNPPRVEFFIGDVKIADIVMFKLETSYEFDLVLPNKRISGFETFGNALRELHKQLNSPRGES
jgi:hypothetical protein